MTELEEAAVHILLESTDVQNLVEEYWPTPVSINYYSTSLFGIRSAKIVEDIANSDASCMAETRFAEAPNAKNSMLFFVEIPTNKTSEIAGWLEATMLRFDYGLLGVTLDEAEAKIRKELAAKGISVFQYWLKDENFAQRVKYVFWDSNLVADFSPASRAGAYDIITASGLIGIEPFSEPIPNARFSLFLTPLGQLPLDQDAEQSSMRICQSVRLVSGICRSLRGEKIDDKQRFIEKILVDCSNP